MDSFPVVPKVEFIDEIEGEGDEAPLLDPQIEAPFGPPISVN